jgi:uncharacterized protein YecA (UPF0149 family)
VTHQNCVPCPDGEDGIDDLKDEIKAREQKDMDELVGWLMDMAKTKPNGIDVDDFVASELGKIGRNDDCICGSGRKFKKCCLNK